MRVSAPLLHQQQVLREVDRVQPVTIEGVAGDLRLGDHGHAGDHEHHEVHRIDTCQTQPPEVDRGSALELGSKAREVRMSQDEAGEREEEIDSESTHAQHVVEHRDTQQAEVIERALQVVEQHPGSGDEADAGELPDEDVVHACIVSRSSPGHLQRRTQVVIPIGSSRDQPRSAQHPGFGSRHA